MSYVMRIKSKYMTLSPLELAERWSVPGSRKVDECIEHLKSNIELCMEKLSGFGGFSAGSAGRICLRRFGSLLSRMNLKLDMVYSEPLTELVECLQQIHRVLSERELHWVSGWLAFGFKATEEEPESLIMFVLCPCEDNDEDSCAVTDMLDRALFAQGLRFQAMQGMDENLD